MLRGCAVSPLLRLAQPMRRPTTQLPISFLRGPIYVLRLPASSSAHSAAVALPGSSAAAEKQKKNAYWDAAIETTLLINTTDTRPKTPEEIWRGKSRTALERLILNPPADAYTGRSVRVVRGQVAEAFKNLDSILSRNKVRIRRSAQRHEKRGVKRRRLSSERWRKQFANEVRKKVQLVIRIRNRGA